MQSQMTFGGAHVASLPTLRVSYSPTKSRDIIFSKKGVTGGMKLTKPEKKTDDVNLDLTIMIDANEELRDSEKSGKFRSR
mmetsp:Transcript_4269/g.5311  ORF Transcript_4269/g.5311 Transcript_4269/m.5311 type:complete len:80 (+) Transcript_4269:724-963(+)